MPGSEGDPRVLDNLVNGYNDTFDDRNMWLAPLLVDGRIETSFNTDKNQLFVSFDQPIVISCIKFWNYSKDRLRGIKELEISLDDNIIYRVSLETVEIMILVIL